MGGWVFGKKVLEGIGNTLCDHYRNHAYPLNLLEPKDDGVYFFLLRIGQNCDLNICHQLDIRKWSVYM